MTSQDVDAFLASLEPRTRDGLEALRRSILAVVPDAEEGLSYGAPAFRMHGKVVAGFSAGKDHLTYLPHSGTVLADLADDVAGYQTSKGALRFAADAPLPDALVEKLVWARLRELGLRES